MACLRTARIPAGRPPGLLLTGRAGKQIKITATATATATATTTTTRTSTPAQPMRRQHRIDPPLRMIPIGWIGVGQYVVREGVELRPELRLVAQRLQPRRQHPRQAL